MTFDLKRGPSSIFLVLGALFLFHVDSPGGFPAMARAFASVQRGQQQLTWIARFLTVSWIA